MNTMRLYTWVDIDAVLRLSLEQGEWPSWLQSASCFGNSLELGVLEGSNVHGWLSDNFGPRLLLQDGAAYIALDGTPSRSVGVTWEVLERPLAAPLKLLFESTARICRPVADVPSIGVDEPTIPLFAFHSFKGGVGRTTAALALALDLRGAGEKNKRRVLLVDADMEAPGITFLLENRVPNIPVSFADLLALENEDIGAENPRATDIVREAVKDLDFDGLVILPAFRSSESYESNMVRPEHLIRNSRDPFIISTLLRRLGMALAVDAIVVDLRAGISEISSGLILDPTVSRVFVTTLGGQSARGTRSVLEKVSRSDEFIASAFQSGLVRKDLTIVFSQVREDQKDNILVAETEALLSACSSAHSGEDITGPRVCIVDFVGELTHMGRAWDTCLDQVRRSGISVQLRAIAGSVFVKDVAPSSSARLNESRNELANFARRTEFAEAGAAEDFLVIPALAHLASDHVSELPIVAVVGQKGAGKSYTYLQLLRQKTWRKFVAVASQKESIADALIFPLLEPINLHGSASQLAVDARRNAAMSVAGRAPSPSAEVVDAIRLALTKDLNESDWRNVWFEAMATALGLPRDDQDPITRIRSCVDQSGEKVLFIVDGLEDLLQSIHTNEKEQRSLRALLLDVISWLAQIPGKPIGLIVFVRKDMTLAAVRQNPGQFLHRFQPYELRWERADALRLVSWVANQSGAIPLDFDSQSEASFTEELVPLWGLKLGAKDSREAYSAEWVLAALSDFKGQVQARDVIRFLRVAAEGSHDDAYWTERLLTPAALKRAPISCGKEKIGEIEQETPRLLEIFSKLRDLSVDLKKVPFAASDLSMTVEEIELLERNGIVLREPDGYYMPEMFRQGLGFVVPKGARPRVLALARRVRSGLVTT